MQQKQSKRRSLTKSSTRQTKSGESAKSNESEKMNETK